MKAYTLKAIPDPLWREVKAIAAREGVEIREIIARALERYVGEIPVKK